MMTARPNYSAAPFTALPFVRKRTRSTKQSCWDVPHTDTYRESCELGRMYAAHFAQYLKDNPHYAGRNMLGHIASEIDFKDDAEVKGYWVGFFSHLERMIHFAAKHVDVFADAEHISTMYAAAVSRGKHEAT